MRCCVPLCEEDSVLHKFPTANEKQCLVWLERIGDRDLVEKGFEELQQYYGVCDSHFEPSCHDSDSDELLPGALPTLHLPGSRMGDHDGSFAMEFLPPYSESSAVLDVIVDGLRDSTHVNIHMDSDSQEEDMSRRYTSYQTEKSGDESEITIHHPEDIEIVARYTTKCENESDDEIILKYPNDDDVIKRYAGTSGYGAIRRLRMCDKGSGTDGIQADGADELLGLNSFANKQTDPGLVSSSAGESNAGDSEERTVMNGSNTETSESNEDFMSDLDVSEHPSDDGSTHQDPGELNSAFEDSCYDSVDADDALRGVIKPGCSSPRNHNITVYNLCCDKKFLSSITIDSPKKDSLPTRGTTRHRDFLHDLVSNSFQGIQRNPFTVKKSRNKNKSKVISRNDNLINVIHSLEKMAQNVETKCIEARRSLRRNCSHTNVLRMGAKLKGEISPLLNSQISLVKKIRTNLP